MAEDRYRINRGNYTLRKKHQSVKDGYVYERDFMATTSPGSWEGDVFSFSENNFKMVRRLSEENKRKHLYGEWFKEDLTLDVIGEGTATVNSESAIYLKPNYGDMTDFAYYAGLEEKLRTTIQYIVGYFPGELYVTDEVPPEYYDASGNIRNLGYNLTNDLSAVGISIDDYTGDNLVMVSNPFEINITYTSTNNTIIDNMSHLRFMCNSYSEYKVGNFNYGTGISNCDWEVLYKRPYCNKKEGIEKISDGTLSSVVRIGNLFSTTVYFFEYYLNDRYILLTNNTFNGSSVRPYEYGKSYDFYRSEFISSLDDFGKLLLNKDSNPMYTCTIYNPVEISNGVGRYKKSFTWPVLYGYNLDVVSPRYQDYVDSLIGVATFYDEGYTNNMWNRMTHDSIKNMDQTLTISNNLDDTQDYAVGASRIESYIQIIANFFDNLKRNTDNIGYANNITYNEYNNLPDYFLSDSLQLSGWEVSEPTNALPNIANPEGKYSLSSTNCSFMRNLKLSAKDIMSRKGTRQAIEEILGMFGLRSYDWAYNYYKQSPLRPSSSHGFSDKTYEYQIKEYVYVASASTITTGTTDTEFDVEKYNALKLNYDPEESSVQGLCCAVKYTNDGNKKYLVPYYTYPQELDGHPYFQMYGGWGNTKKKKLNDVYRDTNGYVKFYDETLKYMGVVKEPLDLTQLSLSKINEGCIYYVIDKGEEYKADTCSHYFTLSGSPEDYSETFYTDDYPHGWKNIKQSDVDNLTNEGLKVAYLESLVDEANGNNPHVGYGKYDQGEEYLKYYKQLFKYSIEEENFSDDAYTCDTGELNKAISGIGFNVSELTEDNVKCWYFTDKTNKLGKQLVMDGDYSAGNWSQDENPLIGEDKKWDRFLYSTEETYDFTNGERKKITEASAYSLINSKVIDICFDGQYCRSQAFKDYFFSTINKYLKQVIPSTAIYRVRFYDEN